MRAVAASGLAALVVALLAACSPGAGGEQQHVVEQCTRTTPREHSVARVWNEALLASIRRDVPMPTVHARNLFHVSAAMWDAWAAYDTRADGYFVSEKHDAQDVAAAREAAISYAAYRLLLHRYSLAAGLETTFAELTATMRALCYRIDYASLEGGSPAALGNRIAAAAIAQGADDGALERQRYVDLEYTPANAPLVVRDGTIELRDPDRWQPLALERQVAQNGVPIPSAVQEFAGPHWGRVRPFALPSSPVGLPLDPGPPPAYGSGAYVRAALDVLRRGRELDPGDGVVVDASPATRGGNSLGANDGRGHRANPATGEPYAPNPLLRGDLARALAEYWADGPDSETPPGHWNTIANDVSDALARPLRVGGDGRKVDRLEWDVKLYFALNGAVHDAAVAAWGVKGRYDSVRPISMIRYLAARGELPLVPGLVKRGADGQLLVRAWLAARADPGREGGVGWVRASHWLPYQRPTFVTPAFAGYVSGHSAFSRAAAEVLTAFTGSPYFPAGMLEVKLRPGQLLHEFGPSHPIALQWATYYDAADDAGVSRLYGGIHIPVDDVRGRRVGAACGREAWSLARRHFEGTARA